MIARNVTLLCLVSAFLLASAVKWPVMANEDAAIENNRETPAAEEAGDFEVTFDAVLEALRMEFGNNTFGQYIGSFLILLLAVFIRKALLLFIFARLKSLAAKTRFQHNEEVVKALEAPLSTLVFVIGLFLALNVLTLGDPLTGFVGLLFQGATLVILFWAGLRGIDLVADILMDITGKRELPVHHFIPLIKKTARAFVMIVGAILVMNNLGYSVGSLIAGLGIGGLAVALAAQESLSNFFGSITIAADRPFKVGDWIAVGENVDGIVEEIGLRSTKVRTWRSTLQSIPNKLLSNEIIENWSKMFKRQVSQVVGVTYETTPEQMEDLLQAIRRILVDDEGVHQDFHMVRFHDFGNSSLDIIVYYFTNSVKWAEHLATRERINLSIMHAIADRGLSIAFPTRTLHLEGDLARRMARAALPGDGNGSRT